MAKLTERVAIANGDISDDDLIHIVHDAGGTPISYKMTVGQLKTFISAITGSGVDNQIAVYSGADTIEGDASLTWDGNTIRVTGDASNKAQLTLDSDSTQNAVINLNTNGGASNSVIQFQVSDLTKYMVGINGEDDDATNQMLIITNGDSFDDDGVIVMKPNGNVGIGLGNSGEPSANKLEVGGADATNASLKIRPQSGTPTTPESGQLRNDAGAPMWYNGTEWVDLAGGGGSFFEETTSSIKLDTSATSNDILEINTGGANTFGGNFSQGNLVVGDGNTIGAGNNIFRRSFVGGTSNNTGASEQFSNNIVFGITNNVNGQSNAVFGQSNVVSGNNNFTAQFTNKLYGTKNATIGVNNIIGTTSADVDSSIAIGDGVDLYGDHQIGIGKNFATNSSDSSHNGIFIGLGNTRANAGFFQDASLGATSIVNFVLGDNQALRSGLGVVNNGSGAGVFYLSNYNSSTISEPSSDMPHALAMWAKDRVSGVTGLTVKAENGGKSWIGDRIGIKTVTPDASLHIEGEGATSGTSSLKIENSSNASLLEVKDNGVINASNLPTSSAGLASGDIWNDGGTLKIV